MALDGLSVLAAGSGLFRAQTSTATGTQHNWAPGITGPTFLLWSGASNLPVTGLAAAPAGTLVIFKNVGTAIAFFAHQSGSSLAANRLQNLATQDSTPVAPGGRIVYLYSGTVWQLVDHEQGAWITPAFVAGDFTGAGSMTWTVAAGDVETDRYRISGITAMYQYSYRDTTVGGTPSADLRRALPALLTPKTASEITVSWSRNLDNGTANDGFCYTFGTGGLFLFLRRDKTSGNWAAATDNTDIQGTHVWEIG